MLTKSKSLVLLISKCQPASFTAKLHSQAIKKVRARIDRPFQIRFVASTPVQPSTSATGQSGQGGQQSSKFSNSINYTLAVAVGTVAGLITGYVLITDSNQFENVNELSRSLLQGSKFEATKFVSSWLFC